MVSNPHTFFATDPSIAAWLGFLTFIASRQQRIHRILLGPPVPEMRGEPLPPQSMKLRHTPGVKRTIRPCLKIGPCSFYRARSLRTLLRPTALPAMDPRRHTKALPSKAPTTILRRVNVLCLRTFLLRALMMNLLGNTSLTPRPLGSTIITFRTLHPLLTLQIRIDISVEHAPRRFLGQAL